MKRPNPGGAFEESILRSLPNRTDVWRRKSPTPPRPAPVAELSGEIGRRAREVERLGVEILRILKAEALHGIRIAGDTAPVPLWAMKLAEVHQELQTAACIPEWVESARALGSQFTPAAGVDLMFSAPIGAQWKISPYESISCSTFPSVVFSMECKSVAEPRIPFERLRKTQEQELLRCAAGGHVAGLLIEWRNGPTCWFVPIAEWVQVREGCGRKSLAFEHCVTIGIEIALDSARGRTARYWAMDEFMRRFGAEV